MCAKEFDCGSSCTAPILEVMLVDRLWAGPVDVVGDVHGELDVLDALLAHLGYRGRDGDHPDGRTLVFVGDLVDRGPKSLAVIDRVRELVAAGRVQCVLGNHELNVLRRDRKEGNDWFFDLPAAEQDRVLGFLATLPLALEREDLRVVHACWHDRHVAALREQRGPVVSLSQRLAEIIEQDLADEGVLGRADRETAHPLDDRTRPPPMLHAMAERNVRRQVAHPVKVLTSGLEEVADAPLWAGGTWRFERRVKWWDAYDGPRVVVGHYWRSRAPGNHQGKGPDLFAGVGPTAPLGPAGQVMCIDYSIGHRQKEREQGKTQFDSALAAYRWPEDEIVFAPC